MKCIAIDFGTKKTGIAVSDDRGTIAVPWKIVPTTDLIKEIEEMLKDKRFGKIVIGESVNSKGEHNKVFEYADKLKKDLEKKYELEMNGGLLSIVFEKEFMTSKHARQEDGKVEVDDRAAALILQRYLDKENKKNNKELQKHFEQDEREEYFDDQAD